MKDFTQLNPKKRHKAVEFARTYNGPDNFILDLKGFLEETGFLTDKQAYYAYLCMKKRNKAIIYGISRKK